MRPNQANASSRKEIKEKEMSQRHREERDQNDLRVVMSTIEGRRFMWNFLTECNAFRSVMHPSGSQTAWNSGQQDVAHALMDRIIAADSDLYLVMQREAYKEQKENG